MNLERKSKDQETPAESLRLRNGCSLATALRVFPHVGVLLTAEHQASVTL